MPTKKPRSQYMNSWQRENRDRIVLLLPKGDKETIKNHASRQGESVNSFVSRAISETMQRDNSVSGASDAVTDEE